jgi:hypothetical protein
VSASITQARVARPAKPHVGERQQCSARAAGVLFAGLLAISVPFVLFGVGSYQWFFRDDFMFLAGRDAGSLDDLFRPHNAHWTTIPIVAFRALWAIFGFRSYLPYEGTVLALHLTACVLLRVIMRRAGVGPWIATAAAGTFVLFGPGEQNMIWAFQIGFTGALVFGLTQLVLCDHDGPTNFRDGLGVLAGALALMSSGVGVAMVVITGVATLARRGWKVALLYSSPLAALYIAWWLVERPVIVGPFGRPPIAELFRWVRSAVIGVFVALGHFGVVAVALAIVLVVGLGLAWSHMSVAEARTRAAIPASMLLGVVVFSVMSAMGRWSLGPEFARSSRYVHIGTALLLPALAVAIDAIARRWRVLAVPLVALLLIAVPWNAGDFQQGVFDRAYMEGRRRVIENVVRMPEASQVPSDVRPIPDVFAGPDLDIGFLLDADAAGKIDTSSGAMSDEVVNEMRVRLGVAQRAGPAPEECRQIAGTLDLSPAKGTVFGIGSPLTITTHRGARATSDPVPFMPVNGRALTIELDDLDLRLGPRPGAESFTFCEATR